MIEKLTKDLINKIIFEIKKEDNKKLIKDDILDPILNEFRESIYPYISILFVMYSLNLILIIVILFLIILRRKH